MVEAELSRPISKAARNERRKAAATTCNAMSVAVLVSASLQPIMAGHFTALSVGIGCVGFVALQLILHYILRTVED